MHELSFLLGTPMYAELLPAPVAELLTNAYPEAICSNVRPTIGGYSNTTLALDIDGIPYILKAAQHPLKRADLRREAAMLQLLSTANLPTAPLHTLLEGTDWTIELLGLLPGEQGIQCLFDPHSSHACQPEALFAELGNLLRRVHQFPPPLQPDLALHHHARHAAERLPLLLPDLSPALQAELQNALAYAAQPPTRTCLLHGDPGAHNLLWNGHISGLIDWEWAALGDPLADLAWVCWTIRFRAFPGSARQAFLAAYGLPNPDPALLHLFALCQIALILTRVAHLPAARAEWVKRLHATLETIY